MLKYLTPEYEDKPLLQLFFTRIMTRLFSPQLIFYLPQIYLSLGTGAGPIIQQFLIKFAEKSVLLSHQLIWMAKVESKNEELKKVPPNLQQIEKISKNIIRKVLRNMDTDQREFFAREDGLFEEVTKISGMCRPQWTKGEKRTVIQRELAKLKQKINEGKQFQRCYMPTNPKYLVEDIDPESGAPMQSKARVPMLVSFKCKKYHGPDQ